MFKKADSIEVHVMNLMGEISYLQARNQIQEEKVQELIDEVNEINDKLSGVFDIWNKLNASQLDINKDMLGQIYALRHLLIEDYFVEDERLSNLRDMYVLQIEEDAAQEY